MKMSLRKRRGANAIEFALVAPILIAIITGIIDYAWFFQQQSAVLTVAREAGRAGTVAPSDVSAMPG